MYAPTEALRAVPAVSSAAIRTRLAYTTTRGITVQRYQPGEQQAWDEFVRQGKNTSFMFLRGYMDYHQDRFLDHSLMLYRDRTLLGLLPANRSSDSRVASHDGLTYGGLVLKRDATLLETAELLRAALEGLLHEQIDQLHYKRMPRFQNPHADDAIDYLLFLLDARLCRRDSALVISQTNRLPLRKGRKSEISKARRLNIELVQDDGFKPFWTQVLQPRLASRYGVKPVHSLAEISLLATRFPEHIRQFSAYCQGQILAGTTIYETETVAHAQYIAVTEEGQRTGALDALFYWLVHERYASKAFFDFGICNERAGRALNRGLLSWKESFGARTCVHDFYDVATVHFDRLDAILEPVPACQS